MMTAKQIITSAKQMTGFYMKHDTGLKWVSAGKNKQSDFQASNVFSKQ